MTRVNKNNKALTVQAGEHYTKHDHEWGCGSSLRCALLGWQVSALGDASALEGPAATRFAHNCLRAYSSLNSVAIQDDLSHALSLRSANPMSGNDNGYPSGITEMSVWRADRHNASNHDQHQLDNAEYALNATAQPKRASEHNTAQHSAESYFVKCPRWHDDKGTVGHATHEVPGTQTAICTTALQSNLANTSAMEPHQSCYNASLRKPNNRGVATPIQEYTVLIVPGACAHFPM